MISSRFPEIHRLSQNRRTAKSMIFIHFPEIHRLSQNRRTAKSMISGCFPKIHRLSQNRQTAKSMISGCFPKIHRLSQNRQTAKSMISSHFPEIHRLSAKKGLGSGDICRPKGRSAPLACCLSHAGGWKCGQGQAARWVVACRGASGPLEGAANRWHSARSNVEGANTHGSLQGHADAPLPGRMSPSRCKFERARQILVCRVESIPEKKAKEA